MLPTVQEFLEHSPLLAASGAATHETGHSLTSPDEN